MLKREVVGRMLKYVLRGEVVDEEERWGHGGRMSCVGRLILGGPQRPAAIYATTPLASSPMMQRRPRSSDGGLQHQQRRASVEKKKEEEEKQEKEKEKEKRQA
eukprot:GHVU01226521.1.p2 GENE.GHVU01226521.1~~GHVU01226521.1.p2  ORF type:complete len:103 (-),score=28.09 GHVU01226521.1:306-614(-)